MTAQEKKKPCEHLIFFYSYFSCCFFLPSLLCSWLFHFHICIHFFLFVNMNVFVRACFGISMHVLWYMCSFGKWIWRKEKRSSIFGYSFVPEFDVCVCVYAVVVHSLSWIRVINDRSHCSAIKYGDFHSLSLSMCLFQSISLFLSPAMFCCRV